ELDGDGVGGGVDLREVGSDARKRRRILHRADGAGVLVLGSGALPPGVEHLVDAVLLGFRRDESIDAPDELAVDRGDALQLLRVGGARGTGRQLLELRVAIGLRLRAQRVRLLRESRLAEGAGVVVRSTCRRPRNRRQSHGRHGEGRQESSSTHELTLLAPSQAPALRQRSAKPPLPRMLGSPSMRAASAVWRSSPELVLALDEQFGPPVDSYVNGSQTWLLDNGPGGVALEWRLHPVASYRPPAELSHYDLWKRVVA